MKFPTVILACLVLILHGNRNVVGAVPQTGLYVSPMGDDGNPGSVDKPIATIAHARDIVRQIIANGLKEDVQVLLRGGTYHLSETVILDSRDSGTKSHSVTYAAYPGETVVISGGRQINGWKQGDNGLWTAVIPEVAAGQWYFRELYVNGKRGIRARTPNADAKTPYYQLEGSRLSDDLTNWEMKLRPGQASNWKDLENVEIVILKTYEIVRKLLANVKIATGRFLLKPPHFIPADHADFLPRGNEPCYLENALAFLDQPGEWYLSRATGELRYWPRAGEDMEQSVVIASKLEQLIVVRGTDRQIIQNLHFRGITFSHVTWNLPDVGYIGTQAAVYSLPGPLEQRRHFERMTASISFEFTDSCSVQDCEISHIGGYGIELRRGCHANMLQGNRIFDIGANGVMVGEARESGITNAVISNKILNNLIHDCGATYYGAVGIWAGMVSKTLIAHNELYNLPYSGISVGWVWGGRDSSCNNNTVNYNHVHNVVRMLDDGGAIYTLGKQPGDIFCGNVLHHVGAIGKGDGSYGLYFDEGGQTGNLLISNVIYSIMTIPPVKCSFGSSWRGDHVWRGNLIFRREGFPPGVVGAAMSFESDGYLDIDHSSALEPEKLSVEAWVKFIEFPSGSDPTVWIVNKNTNEFTNGNYALTVSHNNVGAYLNIGGGREGCYSSWSVDNPVQTNTWNHLAMTYDGHDLKVYCNGVLAGLSTVNRQRSTGSGLLRLGKRADNLGLMFHGLMDEVRIYNQALSAEEVTARFTRPATLDPQLQRSVVGYWPFDDLKERIDQATEQAGPEEPFRSRFAEGRESNEKGRELRVERREPTSPSSPQPSTLNPRQPPLESQVPAASTDALPSTLNPQPSTSKPSSLNPEPSTLNPPPSETLFAQAIRLTGSSIGIPKELLLKKGDRLVAIGDSITSAGGYLRDIEAVLTQQYPELQIPKITNAGVGGQKAENLVARFQKDVIDRHPAIVTINIGINDVWHRLQSTDAEAVLKAYKENVSQMVALAQAAGIQVILLTPTIIQESPTSEGNQRLLRYSLVMRGIARETQCGFVNLHEMFLKALGRKPAGLTDNWLTTDGVHMKPLGGAIMALGVLRALGVPDARIAVTELPEPER